MKNYFFKIGIIFLFFISVLSRINGINYRDYSKGPLYSKNFFAPYLIYYNFPGFQAQIRQSKTLSIHSSIYYTNDFLLLNKRTILTDYESCVIENGFSYSITKKIELGADIRVFSYYGGFLDRVIEAFHHVFLAGAPCYWLGREGFPKGRVIIDIPNYNDISLKLNGNSFSFGDIDTYIKYNFYDRKYFSFSIAGAFKIPSGMLEALSGSSFPDFGFQILADFKPFYFITFYIQTGIVVPFDALFRFFKTKPYPMFNGLVCIEINPVKYFSFLYQINVKTSSIRSVSIDTPNLSKFKYLLSAPQINTLVGIKIQFFKEIIQIYIEENTYTNAGADITFNLMYIHKMFFY